jgi:hypothetical protein
MKYSTFNTEYTLDDVSEGKTKYMVAANTQNCSKPRAIEIGIYNFEELITSSVLSHL